MKIPVTRDRDNDSELIMLNLSDVVYIQTDDRSIAYHTISDVFFPLSLSLTSLAKHTEHLGFRKLDRINLVNTNKIRYFDNEHGKVFFEQEVNKGSKYATVSFLNKGKLTKEINEWIEKNLK